MNKTFMAYLTLIISISLISQKTLAVTDAEFNELKAYTNELATQLEKTQHSQNNLGLSAQTTIGGYGELHYNNLTTKENGKDNVDKKEIDFHRFVLFVNHEFNDKIHFFSEFEIEHSVAGEGKKGEVEIEQAYIEMKLSNNISTKTGVMLVPVGIINETHEPTTFYGVERNPVEKRIIPATWWNGGLSLNGKTDSGLSYDLMISEGLKFEKADTTIRSGRQKTSKATMESIAYTGRVKYTGISGLELSITARYESDLSQKTTVKTGSGTLLEAHSIYSINALTIKALYAKWNILGDDAKASKQNIQSGYYIEPSYKINDKLGLFGRYNSWNITTDNKNKETQIDIGFNYFPHENVVFKADYVMYEKNTDSNKKTSGFNLGVGYQF